jgi:hypothetical protein
VNLRYSSTMRRPIDTSAKARERQLDGYRAMTPQDRLRLADRMSAEVRSLARAGIRARRSGKPSEEEVEAELARILLGPEVAAGVRACHPSGRR